MPRATEYSVTSLLFLAESEASCRPCFEWFQGLCDKGWTVHGIVGHKSGEIQVASYAFGEILFLPLKGEQGLKKTVKEVFDYISLREEGYSLIETGEFLKFGVRYNAGLVMACDLFTVLPAVLTAAHTGKSLIYHKTKMYKIESSKEEFEKRYCDYFDAIITTESEVQRESVSAFPTRKPIKIAYDNRDSFVSISERTMHRDHLPILALKATRIARQAVQENAQNKHTSLHHLQMHIEALNCMEGI